MKQEKLFRECRLAWLEKTFGLVEVEKFSSLNNWLSISESISENHKAILLEFQELLDFNFRNWNDRELDRHSIGPVLSLINFSSLKFNLYSEPFIESEIENWRLYGKPDYLLSSGRREPETPYFVLQQYKRITDGEGDRAAQALATMLAAQALNGNDLPIYGCHVIDHHWYFMTLEGKEYAMSRSYSVLGNDLFDIFKTLKVLKNIVAERVNTPSV